jgi:hypothetical protein
MAAGPQIHLGCHADPDLAVVTPRPSVSLGVLFLWLGIIAEVRARIYFEALHPTRSGGRYSTGHGRAPSRADPVVGADADRMALKCAV